MAWFKTGGGSEKIALGSFTMTTSTTETIECGFKPKKLFCYYNISSTVTATYAYDEDISTTSQAAGVRNGSSQTAGQYPIPGTGNGTIVAINNTGFDFKAGTSMNGRTMYYVAMG